MATERKAPDTSDPEIPDLDVRKAASQATSAATATNANAGNPSGSASASTGDVQDYFGSGTFDADHFGGVGGGLETDDHAGGMLGVAPFGDEQTFSADGGTLEVAEARPRGGPVWPSGTTPEPTALVIDSVEVRLAAGYPPPPKSVVAAPLYTLGVARKRGELEAAVRQLESALSDAETKRNELLVGKALDLRGKVLLAEGGEELFAPVVEIERLALERRSSLAGTNAEYDRRAREIEEKAEGLRREAEQRDLEVDQAARALAEQRKILERATAKKKRLYIEIRGLMDAAEKSGGTYSAAQSARIAELEAAVASHNPEVERAGKDVEKAEVLLAAAEGESKQVSRRLAEAGRLRRALDDEFREQIGVRSEGVTESERERARALEDVMRRILAARGRMVEVPREVLDGIAQADEAVHARALELEKLVRAVGSYDHDAYSRGRVVIGIIVTALIVAIVLTTIL